MKTDDFIIGIAFLITMVFFGFVFLVPTQIQKEKADGVRLDNCIKLVNEIGIPASDIEERSNFLQNCYKK